MLIKNYNYDYIGPQQNHFSHTNLVLGMLYFFPQIFLMPNVDSGGAPHKYCQILFYHDYVPAPDLPPLLGFQWPAPEVLFEWLPWDF
jgi:hypothetical protein